MRGLEKEITLTFQRYVILDAERQLTGSLKVNTDLYQGSYRTTETTVTTALTSFSLGMFMFRPSDVVTFGL